MFFWCCDALGTKACACNNYASIFMAMMQTVLTNWYC